MVQALENAGISSDTMVVIYDNSDGLWASRLSLVIGAIEPFDDRRKRAT